MLQNIGSIEIKGNIPSYHLLVQSHQQNHLEKICETGSKLTIVSIVDFEL